MIELRELTKRYGETVAVDGLSFSVRPGRVTGFLGPNGAGKSTTLRMILGLDRPDGGEARIDGDAYPRLGYPLRRVGALLEAKAVHGGRTARNHLRWLAQTNRLPARRVDEVLDEVGLTGAARRRAGGFSLGMAQRLGIAAAMLGDPPVLLFDEPVNGLDPEGIVWIRELMRRLAREGRTVLVSSHLMSEMALTADHLVVIGRGRLLADTGMTDFVARHSRSFVRVRTPQAEAMLDVLARQGVEVVAATDGTLEAQNTSAAAVGDLAARHGLTVHEVSTQSASLEQAFMRLTAQAVEYRGAGAAVRASGEDDR
ncbi:ABC transporter ATP-binding protein [Streptomyces ziwulingensis]|uniref:ABC transporter ATP-binding protein n=1 Tax=Streptomyces ziwulingensis TaxID=1045501 RepID=A0ABP9BWK5_9ACTN